MFLPIFFKTHTLTFSLRIQSWKESQGSLLLESRYRHIDYLTKGTKDLPAPEDEPYLPSEQSSDELTCVSCKVSLSSISKRRCPRSILGRSTWVLPSGGAKTSKYRQRSNWEHFDIPSHHHSFLLLLSSSSHSFSRFLFRLLFVLGGFCNHA